MGGDESDPQPHATERQGKMFYPIPGDAHLTGENWKPVPLRVPEALVPEAAKNRWRSKVLPEGFK